jgi:hypothetical protein
MDIPADIRGVRMTKPTSELTARQIAHKHVMDRKHQRWAAERKQQKAADEGEIKSLRESQVKAYGEERVLDKEHMEFLAGIGLEIMKFIQHKPSCVTSQNVEEFIDIIERWYKYYEFDPDLDNLWNRAQRIGFLPPFMEAGLTFRKMLGIRMLEQQALPLSAEPSKAEAPAPAAIELPPEPPKPIPVAGFKIGDVVRRVGGLVLFRIVSFPDQQHALCLWDDNGKDEEVVLPISSLQSFTH